VAKQDLGASSHRPWMSRLTSICGGFSVVRDWIFWEKDRRMLPADNVRHGTTSAVGGRGCGRDWGMCSGATGMSHSRLGATRSQVRIF
jgi:hypothetical protein